MKLIVNEHKIEIDKTPVNEKEINVTKCEFEFVDSITNEYVKEAYFTFNGTTYKQIIVNNQCDIPNEVLQEKGTIEIGVVAYLVENQEEIKRYKCLTYKKKVGSGNGVADIVVNGRLAGLAASERLK